MQADVFAILRVVVTVTDDNDATKTVILAATSPVGDDTLGSGAKQQANRSAFDRLDRGSSGADVRNGGTGDDLLDAAPALMA